MKNSLTSLNQVLAFRLEGMYQLVKHLQELHEFRGYAEDPSLKEWMITFQDKSADKRSKLKRIFSYLLSGPYGKRAGAAADLISKIREAAENTEASPARDILLASLMQGLLQYGITAYTEARYIAMRLELDVVVNLLDEILDWEHESFWSLKQIAVEKINMACALSPIT